MEWIEDVFYGAVTKGVNVSLLHLSFVALLAQAPDLTKRNIAVLQNTTVNLFRIACVGCILSLAALAGVSYKTRPDIVPHCIFAFVLACALFGIFTW